MRIHISSLLPKQRSMSCPKSKGKRRLGNWMKLVYVAVVGSLSHVCLFVTPMDCSMPGFPVFHQLPEFAQTSVHWVGDAVQPSHLLLPPSPPAFNLYQYWGLFQWVGSSHQVAKVYVKVKVTQSCPTLCDHMDYTVHGILQAGILELVAFPFSRGSSQPRSLALQVDSLVAEPQGKPKNIGVGSLSFLQQIFPTQESNRGLLHCRRMVYQLSY